VPVDAEALERELAEIRRPTRRAAIHIQLRRRRLDEAKGRQGYAMERIRSLGTVVEVCHTSNHRTCGLKDPSHYPVQQFISNRVPFVVSSDDPGVFDTILADEIDWVVHATGLSPSSFDEITERSWSNLSEVLVSRES